MEPLTQDYFNQSIEPVQVPLVIDAGEVISTDDKVCRVSNLIREMNCKALFGTPRGPGRRPARPDDVMLSLLLYCYSEGIFSTRKMERFCRYDLRGRSLLGSHPVPDHTTFCRFHRRIRSFLPGLLERLTRYLLETGHVSLRSLYLDGTKIESRAGRYTFCWRGTSEKNREKVRLRLARELALPEEAPLEEVKAALAGELTSLKDSCRKDGVVFVHGTGKRKDPRQRRIEALKEDEEKIERNGRHLAVMGERSSYSKTDPDATFMRMKDDHMRNGQLKPAYNIQLASSGGFIVGVMACQKTNDVYALRPFLQKLLPPFGNKVERIVADAGYESAENYAYLKRMGLAPYIKPADHERRKKRRVRTDIGARENMIYLSEEDAYVCKNGKRLTRQKDEVTRSKTGFEDTLWVYVCTQCRGCPYNRACIKGRGEADGKRKMLRYSPAFQNFREESRANILSQEGVIERINRSIQAEGIFSKMKDGLGYHRFRHVGLLAIEADLMLCALALDLNLLQKKFEQGRQGVIEYGHKA